MPPSQLKRLKASLQAEGILGPPQSKRRKKQDIVDGASREKRTHRASALRNIRDQFNPFELQLPSRDRDKFEVTSNKTIGGKGAKAIKGRPGVTKGHGEETVGSLLDHKPWKFLTHCHRERGPSLRRCSNAIKLVESWIAGLEKMIPL